MRRAVLFCAAALVAAASTAAAQSAAQPAPAQPSIAPVPGQTSAVRPAPRLQTTAVSLATAVQSTVERSAEIARGIATVQAVTGQQQSTTGTFDMLFRVSPTAGFTMQQLAPGLRGQASTTRETLAGILSNFRQLTGVLQVVIRNSRIAAPRCPANLVFTFGGFNFNNAFLQQPVNVDRLDPTEQTLLGTKSFLNGTALGDILGSVTLGNICTDPKVIGLSATNFFQVMSDIANSHAIDQSGGQGVIGFLTSSGQIEPENRLSQLQLTDAVAARARLAMQRLGPVPTDDISRTTALNMSLFKPFRNGLTLSTEVILQSQDHKFRDKPYDPSFGGLGQPPGFASAVQFTLSVPLGRGFGYTGVGAPERSAGFVVAGERENLRHGATEQAFQTSLAYLHVIAAQETLAALEASRTRQQRIVQLTESAVQDGEIPRAELDRARARAARVESSLSSARTALITARVSLAEAMGVDADSLEGTPTATDKFATATATLPPTDALVATALSLRRDVRARQQRELASETLAAGAVANLRRRFDFSLNAGIANIYDSPIYRYLPDEQNPIFPANFQPVERAINYYSPRGYYRAVIGRYEPFGVANFSVQLPFGNNSARGRLRQAESTLSRSRIDQQNLTRSIRENVVDVSGQLQRSAAALANWEAAVRADQATLQNAMDRFEIREVTLIDALLTEEAVTSDTLQLISQRQIYLSTLTRLKFETGELLTFDTEGPSIRTYKFDPSFLVAR